MERYKSIYEEINPNTDELLFHGSSKPIKKFDKGILFLTPSEDDAIKFGLQLHNFGSNTKNSYLHTIGAKQGKTYNGDNEIQDFIMEGDLIPEEEYNKSGGDLDKWILNFFAPSLRKKGYRYLFFNHPSFSGSKDIDVMVSLFPEKDLEIFDVEKI